MTESSTSEVPRADWAFVLDGYGRRFDGWLVTVVSEPPGGPARARASSIPLRGVTLGKDGAVSVLVGADPNRHASISTGPLTRVSLERSTAGPDRGETLELESEDRTVTRVRCETVFLAEEVDGLAG